MAFFISGPRRPGKDKLALSVAHSADAFDSIFYPGGFGP